MAKEEKYSKGSFIVAKHVLLHTLLDMESLYFNGLWAYATGEIDEVKTIKTLWHQN